jgi:hypothetical protein
MLRPPHHEAGGGEGGALHMLNKFVLRENRARRGSTAAMLALCRIAALATIIVPPLAHGFALKKCQPGIVEQQWQLSAGVTPGDDSKITNIKMNAPRGGCWEIEACATKGGAAVNCNWGCKGLPKSCKSLCDCNGAWSLHANGTITSVMDGACLTNSGGETVVVSACTGGTNQVFKLEAISVGGGGAPPVWTVTHGQGLCIQGNPAPAPPPPPCTSLANESACVGALDKHHHRRCTWNSTSDHCAVPPPPPPPQPCGAITKRADCRWSKGRDCVWRAGNCEVPPPPPPLPPCALDHSCAHNGMSDVPPMGWRSW